MRKIIAAITMITILVLMTLALTACGSGGGRSGGRSGGNDGGESSPRAIPNGERIARELSTDGRSIIPRTQTVNSVEITNEVTDDENWRHEAFVIVNSQDSELAYVKHAVLVYDRNEYREWVLTGINPNNQNLWSTSPIVGVNASMIEEATRNALLGQTITIDGDEWFVDENTLENISMSNQNTQLANHRDVVIVDVVLGSEARTAQGQIELDFTFNDGWFLNNHIGHTPFASEYRAIAIFELSSEQLIDELVRHDATVLREFVWNRQGITIARDEISNFTIHDYESSNKGASRVYNFSFDLDKDIVMFAVNAQIPFKFDSMSGWQIGIYAPSRAGAPSPVPVDGGSGYFSFTAEVTSVALEGTTWAGTTFHHFPNSNPPRPVTLEFLEVANDGAVRAMVTSIQRPARSTVVGFIDFNNLSISLDFEEWIIEPDVSDLRSSDSRRLERMRHTAATVRGRIVIEALEIYSPLVFTHSGFRATLTDEIAEPMYEYNNDETYDDDEDENNGDD